MVFREDHSFQSWEEHGGLDAGHHGVREKYSLWQLLYLGEALADDWPIPIDVLEGPTSKLVEWREGWRKWLDRAASDHISLDAQWRPLIKLLIALETLYWREVSGSFTPLVGVGGGERIDPLSILAEELTPNGLARHFRLTPKDVEQVHRWLALRAVSIDPIPEWYLLARHSARRRYELLRGEAARAGDLYDACEMLRWYFLDLTGDWLPDCDEIANPGTRETKERRFGHSPPYRGRMDLKKMLQLEGLYPHALHIFVEGDTEQVVLGRLLAFLGYRIGDGAIQLTNIRGIDKARRYEVVMVSASLYATRTVLVADHEGDIERVASRLVASGALDAEEDVLLWQHEDRPSSFEEATFSLPELLRILRKLARIRAARLSLSTAELRAARSTEAAEAAACSRAPRGLASIALELAEREAHGSVRISKTELASAIADQLIVEIVSAGGLAAAGRRREILHRLWFWLVAEDQRARQGVIQRQPEDDSHQEPGVVEAGT